MEKTLKYQTIVRKELEYRQSLKIHNAPKIKRYLIVSEDKTQYILLDVGWFKKRYISGLVFHIEVKEEKIWVHEDNTDVDIAGIFADEGIPKPDIVLAFLPAYAKGHTEYGVIA